MVERLPSMPEALCLVPSIAKAKQKAEGRRHERFSVFVLYTKLPSPLVHRRHGPQTPGTPSTGPYVLSFFLCTHVMIVSHSEKLITNEIE